MMPTTWSGPGYRSLRTVCLFEPARWNWTLRGLGARRTLSSACGPRLFLNLLLMAAECLPGGGIVARRARPATVSLVTIAGPRAAGPPGSAPGLTDEAAAWAAMMANARGLQAPLATLWRATTGSGCHADAGRRRERG